MTETSQPGETNILDEILEMLDQNGNIPKDTKDRLTLKALAEVIRLMKPLKKMDDRICTLERRNIATAFIEHPVPMIAVTFAVFVILNIIAHSFSVVAILTAILRWLGIPVPPL